MNAQTKNLLIGIFVIAACTLLVSFILFLKPSVGDGKKTYYVLFSDINKINVGTRVTYAGKPVGEVVEIRRIPKEEEQYTDTLKRFYIYELKLKVDSSVEIYNTDEVSLQTSGLLGEKSVAIIPTAPPPGVVPELITNQPIYANAVDPIQQAFVQLSEVAEDISCTFKQVTQWLDKNGDDVACAIKSFGTTMDQMTITLESVNSQHLVYEMKKGFRHFGFAMSQIHKGFAELNNKQAFANAGIMIQHLKTASADVEHITADLAHGKGTLGRLIENDDLYLRLSAIMSKADTLMNDVNHYGVLFHLNKTWQRSRTQRLNILNSLESPSNFKNYFQTEVDQINTSMSRLSMLIGRAQESPEREEIMCNDLFRRDFAELMRQAQDLTNSLKLYNQELIEANQGCPAGEQ